VGVFEKLGTGISVPLSKDGVDGQLYPPNPRNIEQPAKPKIKTTKITIIKQQQQPPMPIPHLAPLDIPLLLPASGTPARLAESKRAGEAGSRLAANCLFFSSAMMILLYIIDYFEAKIVFIVRAKSRTIS